MKIFISSPMKNLTEEQIRKNREEAIVEIKKDVSEEVYAAVEPDFIAFLDKAMKKEKEISNHDKKTGNR